MKTFFKLLIVLGLLAPMLAMADIEIDTSSLKLTFSEQGDLLHVQACFPDCTDKNGKNEIFSNAAGMLVFEQGELTGVQHERKLEGTTQVLEFTDDHGQLIRRWQVPGQGWLVSVSSLHASTATLMSGEEFRPAPASGFGNLLEQSRYLFFDGSSVQALGLDEKEATERESSGWFGFRNRYWTAMVLSDTPLTMLPHSAESNQDARIKLQLDHAVPYSLQLYLGPVEPAALRSGAPVLEAMMYSGLWFWLRWICQALYLLLGAIAMLVPHWGMAVVILSVLVGLLMRPLNTIADRLQNEVQQIEAHLEPLLSEIKKNHKGQQQSEKILALYKEEGVHPLYSLKSLMGVFVVIPVFIGAFDMLAENIHLAGECFLWIKDLSHPDAFAALPFSLPFFGSQLNLLPFIMTGFSFIASKLHHHPAMSASQQRKQSRNLVMMSLGFLILFYTFPAGMVLYWTTNNLISVVKMAWKRRKSAV